MELVTQQVVINITKTQLNAIIAEALTDEVVGANIKKALNPFLPSVLTQFPHHTHVVLGETTENGTTATLKMPTTKRTVVPEFDAAADDDEINTEPDATDDDEINTEPDATDDDDT